MTMNILSEEFENGIRWLSLESAAHYADCSSNTIRKWIKMGLNLYQIDGTKRIDKNELDKFIQSNIVI